MTFMEDSAARDAVGRMHGHSYQGRALTVSTADARGTAAKGGADNSEGNEEGDEDVAWKTAPPGRKPTATSSSTASGASSAGKTATKGKTASSKHANKGGKAGTPSVRSWDEWAAPTAKISQRVPAPVSVPLLSPEEVAAAKAQT